MKSEYKLVGTLGANGGSYVLCKVRLEFDLLLTSRSIAAHSAAIAAAAESIDQNPDVRNKAEDYAFLKQLSSVLQFAQRITGVGPEPQPGIEQDLIRSYQTDWVPFQNNLSFATLTKLHQAAGSLAAMRIEYASDGEYFVFSRGADIQRTPLTEESAKKLLAEMQVFKDELDQLGNLPEPSDAVNVNSARSAAAAAAAAALAIGMGLLGGYIAYKGFQRVQKELQEQQREQEAAEAANNAANERERSDRATTAEGYSGGGGGGIGSSFTC